MKLAVCGDSFSAISKTQIGTSYSELLAKKLNWQLLNYARRGCSNGGIRLQIDEAIKQKADFVIVVPTSWDRIEIPAEGVDWKDNKQKIEWGNLLQQFLLNKKNYNGYNKELGIKNINYDKNKNSRMIFETIFSLSENFDHEYRKDKLKKETLEAIKYYINHLYDSSWKQQIDQWILTEGIVRLFDNKIKFSIEVGMLWDSYDDFKNAMPSFIDNHSVRTQNETVAAGCFLYPLLDYKNDPGYHSAPEAQIWLADLYYEIIKNRFGLCN